MSLSFCLNDRNYRLEQLLDIIEIKSIHNYYNQLVKSISNNSTDVKKDYIFVAIFGFKVDGHDFIDEAIGRGASVVIGEKEFAKLIISERICYIQVNNSRRVYASLCAYFYNYPSDKMTVIGTTGSTGKTTTTFMIDKIISQNTENTGLIGTLYTKVGSKIYNNPEKCTTPDALFLQKKLAEMNSKDIEYISMEVSSHALKLDRVRGIKYDIAIFTNLTYDHMKFHEDVEDYYQSKSKLFTQLKNNGAGIINLDDKYFRYFQNNHYTCTYGIKSPEAMIRAKDIKVGKMSINFTIKVREMIKDLKGKSISPREIKVSMPVTGYHNVYNALASFSTTLLLGFDLKKIVQGLESFTGVPRRMDIIYDEDFMIIDDFAHNPASLKANFKTIQEFNYNKLVIIHFLKGNRGVEANLLNARVFSKWKEKIKIKELITTRAENSVIKKNRILPEEEKAFTKHISSNGIKISNYNKLKAAIIHGLKIIDQGDILLLVGGPGLNKARDIIPTLLDG